jgi:hypothetical protein
MLTKLFLGLIVLLSLTFGFVGAQDDTTNSQNSNDKQAVTNESTTSDGDLESLVNELNDENVNESNLN